LLRFFTREALTPLLSRRPFVFRADENGRAHLSRILHTLLAEYTRAEKEGVPHNEAILAGYLYQLLFTMAYATNAYVPHDYADGRVTQATKYIKENYNQLSNIEEIAEHFYISKYHLCRIFNKNLGIPLIAYLNTIKIREACRMIKRGEENLTEIAMQCGFNSSSYFCKVFKNEKGISPTEYRKRHK
jgi:AraC-like DNA-binding protein